MSTAYLALGSNLGDRRALLGEAVAGLGGARRAVSGLYETPPWGDADQPAYLNAIVRADDDTATPSDWLRRAHELEESAGRQRDPSRRYGPRTLDVDVVAVFDPAPVVSADPVLTLPHPRAARRAFVLVPLHELAPDLELPGAGPVAELLGRPEVAADVPGVRRIAGGRWWEAHGDD